MRVMQTTLPSKKPALPEKQTAGFLLKGNSEGHQTVMISFSFSVITLSISAT